MYEQFINLREEQLNVAMAVLGAFCVLALFLFALLLFTGVGDPVRAAVLGSEGAAGEPTPVSELSVDTLPPTWTPRATNTPTFTSTPTETPEPTNTPTITASPTLTATEIVTPTLAVSETAEPDYAATIAAAQSATPVPPPPPPTTPPQPQPVFPPTPIPPPPVVQPVQPTPVPPPPTEVPPTPTPQPTPTPTPLYILTELLGGPDCGYSGISGTVRNPDGTARVGVQLEVFNEYGYRLQPVTNANGFYEAFLDTRPRADLAGPWHIRVLEGGEQQSNEIIVVLSSTCTNATDVTKVVANFLRTQ